ncbi:sigma-70 family RNA polymerase sigma factor [Pseudomethylobacillus aquaticus]|uniref:sigma-70 family RNA polymerase sigma factor n=1 Tax=Pseudomethylobacillus aquaticus TaxID=2676064 RepID=UPI0011CE995A|nr:sigma-70 family RNA polymerase sigma factor [Pseudomethylobacillus aquaticus]
METAFQASAIWEAFLRERSGQARETLIQQYSSFANMLAAKLYANRQVDHIEFDEFRQHALVGLMESIDRYDPMHGASFETFAAHRIKGAILTGVEKYCERQEQISARARLRKERMQQLLLSVAEANTDPNPFMRLVDIALGTAIGYMLDDSGMYQSGQEVQEHNVYRSHELRDLIRVVDRLVTTLPEAEEKVIRYHYFQQVRFDHIAERMQISKGRVSQIHHRALRRLYEHYDELKLLRTDY